jgi:putative ABC transport system permease protein
VSAFSRLLYTLRALTRRRRAEAELDEEFAFHLDREAAMLERTGLSPEDARREAERQFGGVLRYREETQDVRGLSWLDDLRIDSGFALRLVRRYPSFSANVIIIAALGIAACATTFSLVSGILLSPLPFSRADRVATLLLRSPSGNTSAALPLHMYETIAAGSPVIDAIAAFSPGGGAVDWSGEPERIRAEFVTASFFNVFELPLVLGRAFTDSEARENAPLVVLGHELWRTRFNSDSTVIDRRITLDDRVLTIIGVMPPRFRAHLTNEPGLWLPMSVTAAGSSDGHTTINAVVRVSDTVTLERADSWLGTSIHARLAGSARDDSVSARPILVPMSEQIYGYVQQPLYVLLGAVLLVLLLVAANIGTMFLARSAARDQELGVRRALGASRGRQTRQLVTEAVTLTAIGGVLGIAVSYWGVGAIRDMGLDVLPRMDAVALDWRVVLFAVSATMLTGVVGGLAPALASARRTSTTPDVSAARVTSQRTSSALVVAQIALSVVLLVGGGLLMKSFLRIVPDDPGFATTNRATLIVALRGLPSFPDTDRVATRRFVHTVSDRMRTVRGARDVAAMSFAPFFGSVSSADIEIPGRPAPDKPFRAYQNLVTTNFFDVIELPLRAGRGFTPADNDGAERVVVVNETAASRWWPGENPVGKQVSISQSQKYLATVIGMAGDTRSFGGDTKIRPEIFLPVEQHNPRFITFVVHTSMEPSTLLPELKRALWSVAPRLPIGTASDLETIAMESVQRQRFFSVAITSFAIAAVVLTALGIYGLLAFAVVQRRREIGIRIALGAPARSVGGLVMRRALVMGVAGVAIGMLLATWLSKYMEAVLLEVATRDAAVFGSAAFGVLVVAIAAACLPVFQALRVDPMESLRV